MGEETTGGGVAAAGFDGKLKEWPETPLEIKKYSSKPKNNFIIDLAAKLYANAEFEKSSKTPDVIARECIQKANTLANYLSQFFE